MKKILKLFLCLLFLVAVAYFSWHYLSTPVKSETINIFTPTKTTSQVRIGLQVGHLNIANVPAQLSDYKWDLGAQVGDTTEVSLNYEIANEAANDLRHNGYIVDILTAAVPPNYTANAVVAIHADTLPGGDTTTSGFDVGASAYDTSGKASTLALEIDRAYGNATGLNFWPAISDAMTSYYSFDSNKFTNSINSSSPAALIELGFISNDQDRSFLLGQSETAAKGLAQGIEDFINGKSVSGLTFPTSSNESSGPS